MVTRSFKSFAVAVLTILLAASMLGFASAPEVPLPISVHKVTTNGDTTTLFHFTLSSGGSPVGEADLAGGSLHGFDVMDGAYILRETVPSGWALKSIECGYLAAVVAGGKIFGVGSFGVASYEPQFFGSTFAVNLADHSVTIVLVEEEYVACTFTNSPAPRSPVGGFIEPISKATVFVSYLALFGLVAAVAIVVVKPRKRRET